MAQITYQDRPEPQYITEEGYFTGEISAAKEELKNGDSVFVLTLTSLDGLSITDRLYFTDRAAWRVEKYLKKLGIMPKVEKGEGIEVTPENFVGEKLKWKVSARSYMKEGEKRTTLEVKDIYAIDEEFPGEKTAKPATATVTKTVVKAAVKPTAKSDLDLD